ncbi:glycosyl transferase family protein [Beijerinckia mobilis]|uniref:glycosyl transferase family protein n=1 Tax=Beijerinckia mobilis TaxID=231434 RepID=UPI0009FF242D|nr:glycosyl transferase family protein [Beijerinckia mobilis]
MPLYWPFFIADYSSALERAVIACAIVIFISSVDDLFVDACFWGRKAWFFLRRQSSDEAPSLAEIEGKAEQPIAIMVPAWLEYDVIARMVETMVGTLDYAHYAIFVGVYANDARTAAEVERMRRRYPHLVRVTVPHGGPTCKSDCLNWIVRDILAHEQTHGVAFAGVVLHDSEDVVHPLELRLFNSFLPGTDLIQIPVMSLEREWYELIAGTYMDEFAEWHGKDLIIRERLSGMVLSAGVGTCFSRRALLLLSQERDQQPFNVSVLTEDYDIGVRLAEYGMRSAFCRFPVSFVTLRHRWFGYGRREPMRLDAPLCVREFFPDTFRTSYRQKARWTLGISFQGWREIGWRGSLATKYFLYRDRKGLVTSLVVVLAYFVTAQMIVLYVIAMFGLWPGRYPSLFLLHPVLFWLLAANGVALCLRLVQRFYFTRQLYGWEHGVLSLPRALISNFVNFAATVRAWRLFLSNLFFGTPLGWDKTMHFYPSAEAIGHVPHSHSALDEETIAEAVAYALQVPRVHLTALMVRNGAAGLPQHPWHLWHAVPYRAEGETRLCLAIAAPLSPFAAKELAAHFLPIPGLRIARESEIEAALRLLDGESTAFGAIGRQKGAARGTFMIDHGFVDKARLAEALDEYDPEVDGLVGEYLLRRGVLTLTMIEAALAAQYAAQPEGQTPVAAHQIAQDGAP